MTKHVRTSKICRRLTSLTSTSGLSRFDEVMVLIARSHALDAQHIQKGQMEADELGFFRREFVKSLKLSFPEDRASD